MQALSGSPISTAVTRAARSIIGYRASTPVPAPSKSPASTASAISAGSSRQADLASVAIPSPRFRGSTSTDTDAKNLFPPISRSKTALPAPCAVTVS